MRGKLCLWVEYVGVIVPVISEVKQNILMLLTVMLYESKTNSIQNYSFKVYLDIVTLLICLNKSYFVVFGENTNLNAQYMIFVNHFRQKGFGNRCLLTYIERCLSIM